MLHLTPEFILLSSFFSFFFLTFRKKSFLPALLNSGNSTQLNSTQPNPIWGTQLNLTQLNPTQWLSHWTNLTLSLWITQLYCLNLFLFWIKIFVSSNLYDIILREICTVSYNWIYYQKLSHSCLVLLIGRSSLTIIPKQLWLKYRK